MAEEAKMILFLGAVAVICIIIGYYNENKD